MSTKGIVLKLSIVTVTQENFFGEKVPCLISFSGKGKNVSCVDVFLPYYRAMMKYITLHHFVWTRFGLSLNPYRSPVIYI